MHRILSLLTSHSIRSLLVLLALAIGLFTCRTGYAAPDGDANGDGKVDIADALRLLRISVGLVQPTAQDLANGDVAPLDPLSLTPKGNVAIDIADALAVLRHAVNLDSWIISKSYFVYPQNGATRVDGTTDFQWLPHPDAQAYALRIGTGPGGKDIYDGGETTSTRTFSLIRMPPDSHLYARISTRINGIWSYSAIEFDTGYDAGASVNLDEYLVYPAKGAAVVDSGTPFEWRPVPGAAGYRLVVGTTPGDNDVDDSGVIRFAGLASHKRYLNNTRPGAQLHARLYVKTNDTWNFADIPFSVADPPSSSANMIDSALSATLLVRKMASASHHSYAETELDGWRREHGKQQVFCSDYALVLLKLLQQMGIAQTRAPTVAFANETHQVVEIFNRDLNGWMMLDPTFALAAKRTADDRWASVEEIRNSINNWNSVDYLLLDNQITPARYYIDYPLLFADIYYEGSTYLPGGITDPFPFLDEVPSPVTDPDYSRTYFFHSPTNASDKVQMDGTLRDIALIGTYRLSRSYLAKSIDTSVSSSLKIYQLKRYVFGVSGAVFTQPATGGSFDGPATFSWTTVPEAQAYLLRVGTSSGGQDLYQSGETQATTLTVPSLPANQTLYARISTKINGVWHTSDISFTSVAKAVFSQPLNGGALDGSASFTWTAVPNAQAYALYVGTTPGGKDLFQSGETQDTSRTILSLPANQPLFARITTRINGIWYYNEISFTSVARSTFVQPINGGVLDGDASFSWNAAPNAQAYRLWVGTAPGSNELFDSGDTPATSLSVPVLPANRILYARISTKIGGQWFASDITFTRIARATFLQPVNGGVLDGAATFTWTAVPNAQAYYLWVGTTPGGTDLYTSGETTDTSRTLANLPPATTLYARINTKINGQWFVSDIAFTRIAKAAFVQPVNGGVLDGAATFTWTAVPNAQAYHLRVGSTPGTMDLYTSGEITATGQTVANLPVNQSLYASIGTRINDAWYSNDVSFMFLRKASLTYPRDGQAGLDRSRYFEWNPVPNAQGYYLWIGTTPGGKELYQSGLTQRSYCQVNGIQADRPLYIRLWTVVGGQWYFTDTLVRPVAAIVSPVNLATGVDFSQPFQWSAIDGAEKYRLKVWTSPTAADLFDSGEIDGTSIIVPGLPTDRPAYVRLWTRIAGAWHHTDATFNPVARFIYPLNGENAMDASRPFEWVGVNNVLSYTLRIGTTSGDSDVFDSGPISGIGGMASMRRFVDALPVNVPLYARLTLRFAEGSLEDDIAFTVAASGHDFAKRLDSAFWATRQVRNMANRENRPIIGTELETLSFKRGRPYSTCLDYQSILMQLMGTIDAGASRVLNINFNSEVHTLVEFLNGDQQEWMILDPTFALSAKRASDSRWATFQDIQNATLGKSWSAIAYQFLDVWGDTLARGYYIDYPLLFLNRFEAEPSPSGNPSLPYLDEVPLPVAGTGDFYLVQNPLRDSAELLVDGQVKTLTFTGVDGLSQIFPAESLRLPEGSSAPLRAFRTHRYVFR